MSVFIGELIKSLYIVLIFLLLVLSGYFVFKNTNTSVPVTETVTQIATPTSTALVLERVSTRRVRVPKKLIGRTNSDEGFALGFAQMLCSINYANYKTVQKTFQNILKKDLLKTFLTEFFSNQVTTDIVARKLVLSFKVYSPVRIVALSDGEDQFLVEGILSTKTNSASLGYRTFCQPIAMLIGFSHGAGTEGLVDTFRKVMPSDKLISEAVLEDNGITENFTFSRPTATPSATATIIATLPPSGMDY
jgi:hypothetical protein